MHSTFKMDKLTLISLNARGLTDRVKRKNIFEWCKKKEGNIVFLQETFSTPLVTSIWKNDWDGPIFFSHGTNHSKGVLVMYSSNINFKIDRIQQDVNGRYIFIKGELEGAKVILANVYFPTRDKVQLQLNFLSEIDNILENLGVQDYSIIMGGDCNVILNMELDYMGPCKSLNTKSRDKVFEFLQKYDLCDVWRKRNPLKKEYTFRQKSPLVQSRLDYLFISAKLMINIDNCDILVSITPDHSGVRLQFCHLLEKEFNFKSYWKFNSSLCMDKQFVEGVRKEIENIETNFSQEFTDKLVFWDFMKMKLRQYIMKYSSNKAKERRSRIENIEKEIKALEEQLEVAPLRVISEEITNKKTELRKLYDYAQQGLRIRSRAEWFEEDEHNPQYFEQLLKTNKRRSIIKELYNEDNILIRDKKDVLEIIKKFYMNLYDFHDNTGDEVNERIFLENLPKLSSEAQNHCEGKMTMDECFKALRDLKTNRSPGNDGFTVEFYYTFWPYLGRRLVDALNESFEKKVLTNSQRQGVITLIEKEGKNNSHIKNYRPITLLNVDYKILSKVLSTRIKGVLEEIIHYDQVGYIKGRNIGEAVRLIDDMFFRSLHKNLGILVAIDFEKAFDSISHRLLFNALKSFGFGEMFCNWVKILYTDITSCVMNGGQSTGYFEVKRGVRQGDPLSPYLFIIAIELLALTVRKRQDIEGIKLGNKEVKQVLYADDLSIFVKNVKSMNVLKKILTDFEKISGLKVNEDKTNFVRLGNNLEKEQIPLFGNEVHELKILGIYFTRNIQHKDDLNYKEILSKIKRLLGWWKQRDVTLMGKIQLLKTYALSKLNYVASLITIPKFILNEIEKISFDFIWGGKDRIKRKIMYQDYEFGGLRTTNYETFVKTQRISWIKRLLYGEHDLGWKISFNHFFEFVGGKFIFLCDYDTRKMKLTGIPSFYVEMLTAWQDLDKCRNFEGNKNSIIFNNKKICVRSKMIFDWDLFQKGIVQVSDIIDNKEMKPRQYFWDLGIKSNGLLKIYDICTALPDDLKEGNIMKIDAQNYEIQIKVTGNAKPFMNVKTKEIYSHFILKFQQEYVLKIRDGHTDLQFTPAEIKDIFLRVKSSSLSNRQREFQFKLLHGALYTNEKLYNFGYVRDNLCSFCHREVETYSHLFLSCETVQNLWRNVIQHLKLPEINITEWKSIFIGLPGNSFKIKICNCIIFFLKQAIYKSRNEGKIPTFETIKRKLIEYKEEEKQLASKRGKIALHLQKWEQITI